MNKILGGDKRSAAKAISIIENTSDSEKQLLLEKLYPHTGKARLLGITGPPGAGKSTLVDGLIEQIRQNNFTVGVIAVDPSSPFTGGAILGDRVRMQRHSLDSGVYIRSMGSRGESGGLAKVTTEAINVLDAMGLDIIIIETVGVGQSEIEIMNIADLTILVLNPNSGDSIQAFKAGIMEIANIFVLNKSDLPGADKTASEIQALIEVIKKDNYLIPSLIKTDALKKQGLEGLWQEIKLKYDFLHNQGLLDKARELNLDNHLKNILLNFYNDEIEKFFSTNEYKDYKAIMIDKGKTPYQVAKMIYNKLGNN